MSQLKANPVAIITGSARGIGRRTAEVLAEKGYTVVLNDLSAADDTEKAARKLGSEVMQVLADVSNEKDVDAMADRVLERYGRVDVIVNNAGISMIASAVETSPQQWRRVLDINLTGPFLLCRKFGPVMLGQCAGSIVNVASVAGLTGIADRAAYNASKHGLIGLTKTLAAEWGGFGVRCNAVCPAWVKTEMDLADQSGGAYTDEDICARVPMARFANPDDVAQAIAFLADPKLSGYLNGHSLAIGWRLAVGRQLGQSTSATPAKESRFVSRSARCQRPRAARMNSPSSCVPLRARERATVPMQSATVRSASSRRASPPSRRATSSSRGENKGPPERFTALRLEAGKPAFASRR